MDLKDFRGQETAKRALEVAAVGRHSLLLEGPRGQGKTTLIRLFAEIAKEDPESLGWFETRDATADGIDRQAFDLYVQIGPLSASDWVLPIDGEPTEVVARRHVQARTRRNQAEVKGGDVKARELLSEAFEKMRLSPGDSLAVERVAASIAALDSETVAWDGVWRRPQIAEALAYRWQGLPLTPERELLALIRDELPKLVGRGSPEAAAELHAAIEKVLDG